MIFVRQIDDSAGILCCTYENTCMKWISGAERPFSVEWINCGGHFSHCWPGGINF